MVGRAIEGRSHSGIKIKMCSTMFLHSKEGTITTTGTRLQKAQPDYDTAINWRSN